LILLVAAANIVLAVAANSGRKLLFAVEYLVTDQLIRGFYISTIIFKIGEDASS
jgi:hypothetical protein